MSAVTERLEKVKAMINTLRDDKDSIRRIPNVLVQCTFPHRDPGDVEFWSRSQNGITILIRPFVNADGKRMYPYGAFSRLLLYWVSWEAMYSGERKIPLGRTFHNFAKKFGLRTRGRDRDRLMSQMLRLFRCQVEFRQDGKTSNKWETLDFTSKGDLAWDERNVQGRLTPESYIVLGENFYNSLRRHPVPIDMRAIQGLKHSAMALDLYTWGTYQTFRISNPGEGFSPGPKTFSWRQLMYQFGADYRYPSEFKEKIPHVLRTVLHVYPEFTVELLAEGMKVFPSRPAVLPDDRRAPSEA